MANYTKATNFAAKDGLPPGNAGKIVKGTEIDTEFTAIASAIASKADTNSPTFTGTPTAPTASSNTNTTQLATTAFVQSLGGRVVQTVVGTSGAAYTTSTSYTSTGLTASITPTSTSSKILILAHAMVWQTNAFAGGNALTALFRNGANLVSGSDWTIVFGQPGYNDMAITHLDSPASVSSQTYAIFFKAQSSGDVAFNSAGNAGSIILMEIL